MLNIIKAEILKQKRNSVFFFALVIPLIISTLSICFFYYIAPISSITYRLYLTTWLILSPLCICIFMESILGIERTCQHFQLFYGSSIGRIKLMNVKLFLLFITIEFQFVIALIFPAIMNIFVPAEFAIPISYSIISAAAILFIPLNIGYVIIVMMLSLNYSKWLVYSFGGACSLLNCIFMTGNGYWYLLPSSWNVVITHLFFATENNIINPSLIYSFVLWFFVLTIIIYIFAVLIVKKQ